MHKNKIIKIALILFSLAIVCTLCYVLFWNNKTKTALQNEILPVVDVAKIDLVNLSEEKADLLTHLKLDNNAPVGISIDSIAYTVFLENQQVAQSMYPEAIDLNANDSSMIKLPFSLYYKKVVRLFNDLKSENIDSTTMKINMVLYSKLVPSGTLHLEVKKNIPIIEMPRIAVQKIHVEKMTAKGAIIGVTLQVENPNTMDFSFRNLSYNIKFEDHEGITGTIEQPVIIPAKDSTVIPIPVALRYKDVIQTLGDYIKKGKDLQYDLTLTTTLITTMHSLKNSEVIIHSNGKIKTIEKAAKE